MYNFLVSFILVLRDKDNHYLIMREVFDNPVGCIENTMDNIKNLSETIKYDYFGCSNCRKYQEMLVDYFGLKDGELKLDRSSEIDSKYGFNPNVVFSWFCDLFLERVRKSQRSKNIGKEKQLRV